MPHLDQEKNNFWYWKWNKLHFY